MRHLLPVFVVLAVAAAPTAAWAQSVVDLSKPQTGKARFVLNSDLTPADLGVPAEKRNEEATAPAARIPACGEGCRMLQPEAQKPVRAAYGRDPAAYRSGNSTRVFIINGGGSQRTAQQTSEPQRQPAPRRTFRFRRR